MKIVIVGPPHSGKSVFLGGLKECLPRESYFLFRACPDGEGSWTWKSPEAAKYRRKGTFTSEVVDWYVKCLSTTRLAPITLVDIGGRVTEENRRILCEGKVNAAILISGTLEAIPEWKKFLASCGISVLAEIHSDYYGQDDDPHSSPMRVHYLERGVDVSSRPVIKKVAAMLLDLVADHISPDQEAGCGKEEKMDMTLSIPELAKALGKISTERTLPNGRVVSQIVWEPRDLVEISRLLHNKSGSMPDCVDIDGAAPAWLVTALVHELHPRAVRLNSPDGFIPIGCKRPSGDGFGENLEFSLESKEGGWVILTCQMADPSLPLSPGALGDVVPPELPMGSKIILSGRMPNWLATSIAMSYHGIAKGIAMFQPGAGATVAWTHSTEVELGSTV